jgi:hypothetical protein
MNAEPAGDASVNDVTEQNHNAAENSSAVTQDPNQEQQQSDVQLDASSARVAAILRDEGFEDEEIKGVVKPEEKPNAEKTEASASASDEEKPRAGESAAAKERDTSKEADPKAKGDEEDEPLTPEQQKAWPPEALKRIHKAAGQRNQAREEAKQLRMQLAKATRPTVGATEDDPLADVDSPQLMERAIKEYRDLRQWAQENPDGVSDQPIGKDAAGNIVTRDYSAKEMAAIVAKTTRILEEHVPRKIHILSQQHLHEQVAKERLPEMFEEGTEANRFYKQALKELPGVRNIPGSANYIRWAWKGLQLDIAEQEAAKTKANGNGKEKVKVDPKVAPFLQKHPPMAPGVPAARATTETTRRQQASSEEVKKAQERVQAGEGEEAEVDFVTQLRESQAAGNGAVLV